MDHFLFIVLGWNEFGQGIEAGLYPLVVKTAPALLAIAFVNFDCFVFEGECLLFN